MTPQTFDDFWKVTVALLIVLDPIAIMPVMVGLFSGMDQREARRIMFKVVGSGTILLLFFTVTGTWTLTLFGVTLDDLRIGGGLLLLLIALRMVIEGHIGLGQEQGYRAAIIPLISPLLAGPGAITASIVLAGVHGIWFTCLAVIAAMLVCLLLFLSARSINRLIGESGAELVTRIMGMLIATIAVSYMRAGLIGAIKASGF